MEVLEEKPIQQQTSLQLFQIAGIFSATKCHFNNNRLTAKLYRGKRDDYFMYFWTYCSYAAALKGGFFV